MKTTLTVLVAGGRVGVSKSTVFAVLDELNALEWAQHTIKIVHGAAAGVDRYAGEWAQAHRIPWEAYPVSSAQDGYRENAPKQRNIRMLQESKPDVFVAFPGGPGTRHMYELVYEARIPIYDVDVDRELGTFSVREFSKEEFGSRLK